MKHLRPSAICRPLTKPLRGTRRRVPLVCAASIALFAASHFPSASAALVTWTGAGGDALWTTAANWGGVAPVAGDALFFDGVTQLSDTNDFAAATTFLGLTFNAGAGSFVLSGNSINSTGGIVNNSLNLQTVNLDLIFASTHSLNSIAGGTMVIGGVISGAGGATKTGGGTVILTKANLYTGPTAVNSGTLKLDFAAAGAPTVNIISTSSALQLGGGALTIQGAGGGTNAQTFASTTFNAGLSSITVTPGAGGTASLALGNVTTAVNSAVRFGNTGTVTVGTIPTGINGILGTPAVQAAAGTIPTLGYATYGLDDFAALSGGAIVGGASVAGFYTNTYQLNFDMIASTNLANGGAQRAATVVRWNTPAATTLTAGTSNLVTFTGALVTPNMGAVNAAFATGAGGVWQVNRQTSPNGAQQATIWQNNTLGYFNVSIPIVDGRENALDPTQIVKAGAGTVVFSGASAYTGRTSIYEGALMIGADNNLGAATGSLTIAGGTLLANATFNLSSSRAITVGVGGTGGLAATTGNTLTIGSVIGGTGEVAVGLGTVAGSGAGTANGTAVLGDGKVTLTAPNTFSGGTSIYAGTLNVNGINALGGANYAGLKIAGGTLQYATTLTSGSDFTTGKGVTLGAGGATIDTNGNAVSYAAGLTGTGGLTKSGNGTLTLNAAGTYAGNTVVNGGTLKVASAVGSATGAGTVTVNNLGTLAGTGTLGGAVTINTGGTLDPGASVGTLTLPGLTLGLDSLLRFEFNTTPANDQVFVTGLNGLAINGGKFSVFAEGTSTAWNTVGTYNLLAFSGAIQGAGTGALSVINPAAGYSYSFGSGGGFVTMTVATTGLISNWVQTAGGTLGTAGNWSNGVPDQIGATANLGSALGAADTITLDGGRTVGGLTFNNANGYTVAQGTGGSLTFQKSTGSADVMVLAGSHAISAPVVLASNLAADIGTGGTLAISGQISGAKSLAKRGDGTLVLGSANLYSLGTTLEAGVIELRATAALGTAALSVTGAATLRAGSAALAPANNVTIGGGVTATVDTQGNTFTLAGIISDTAGNGALTKSGSSTLVLTGTNTYGGTTTVNAGILNVIDLQNGGTPSSIGQSPSAAGFLVLNGAYLAYTGAGSTTDRLFTIGTGGASLDASGTAAVVFSNAGALAFAGADTARAIILRGTSLAANTLTPSIGNNGTGATTLYKADPGTWVLANANTFSGPTQIFDGILTLGHSLALQGSTLDYAFSGNLSFGTLGAASVGGLQGSQPLNLENTLAGGVALTVGGKNTATTYGSVLSGTGSLIKTGNAVLTLSGVSTFTGSTTINSGAIYFAVSNALSGTNTIFDNIAGGVRLANGVSIASPITVATAAGEFIDVPDAGAAATLAGNVFTAGSTQYRLGIGGAGGSLTVTGTHTVGGAGTISFITRGNIVFAGAGALNINTANDTFQFGRQAGQPLTLLLKDSASITTGVIGFGGGQAGGAVTVTLQDSAAVTAALGKNFDFHGIAANVATTVNLNGGTLTVGSFTKFQTAPGRESYLNFNGGTLRAGATNPNFLPALAGLFVNVQAGGAKIDTNGFEVTILQPLAHDATLGATLDGGLTKSNAGKLTLTAVNTYTGTTLLTGGTLNVNADTALGDAGAGVAMTNGAVLQAGGILSTGTRTFILGGVLGGTIDTNGNAVTLAAGSTVTGTALTKTGLGALTLAGSQTYATLNANGGVTNVNSALGTGTSAINANAAVNINASQTLAALAIAAGVEVTFGDGLPFASGQEKMGAFGAGVVLVPEPCSAGLLLVGALGLLGRRRRR